MNLVYDTDWAGNVRFNAKQKHPEISRFYDTDWAGNVRFNAKQKHPEISRYISENSFSLELPTFIFRKNHVTQAQDIHG